MRHLIPLGKWELLNTIVASTFFFFFYFAGLEDRTEKINRYQILFSNLPDVNRETLKALIHHLVW